MNTEQIRNERNKMLSATDWTQMPDAPLTEEDKLAWNTYRQELRDIMNNDISFFDIDGLFWPIPPSKYSFLDGSGPNLACMYL